MNAARVIAAATMGPAFLLMPTLSQAQQPALMAQVPQGFRDDPYVRELVRLIELWNTGDLKLPPHDVVVRELQNNVQTVTQRPTYAYQTNTWATTMLNQAQALPATLQPRSRITEPAGLVLVSLFIKDIDDFKQEVPVNEVRSKLEAPLFLILSRAQELSKEAQIEAGTMLRAVFTWWTTVWPFCDR